MYCSRYTLDISVECPKRGRGGIFNFLWVGGGMDLFWNNPVEEQPKLCQKFLSIHQAFYQPHAH